MDPSSIDPVAWADSAMALPLADQRGQTNPELQQLTALADVLVGFVANQADDPHSRQRLIIRDALAKLCRVAGADRATYYEIDALRTEAVLTHDWHAASAKPLASRQARVDLGAFPILAAELLRQHDGFVLSSLAAEWFHSSFSVAIPVVIDGRAMSVLVLHWVTLGAEWSPPLQAATRVLAHLVESSDSRSRLLDRPSLDEDTGLANPKMALLLLGHALGGLDTSRPTGVAVLQCELTGLVHPATFDRWTIDQVLFESARVLRQAVGETGVVARFAPSRFVVVCSDVFDAAAAVGLAERARGELQDRLVGLALRSSPIGWTQMVDARFGVAFTDRVLAPGVLLRQADSAAWRAVDNADKPIVLALD